MGCGSGYVLQGLHKRFPSLSLSGAEIFVEGLSVAARRVPDARLYQMTATRIPFREEFDLVGAFDVLEHLDDDALALAQLRKSLKPGGGILVSVPQHPSLWGAPDEFAHHRRRYRRKELVARLESAGFQLLQVSGFVFSLLPAMLASRMRRRRVDEHYDPNSELALPRPLNAALEAVLNREVALIARGISLPAGGSLFAVARRPS